MLDIVLYLWANGIDVYASNSMARMKKHYNIPDGYEWFKDHQPFGYCPSFRKYNNTRPGHWEVDTDAPLIFIYSGVRYSWEELKVELRKNWLPYARDDVMWKEQNVG